MVFNGSCNTVIFNEWVEKFLIKGLEPEQFDIMYNASFHKSQRTKELIESAGCKNIFLPPYSPNLNQIEKFWANMKRVIKYTLDAFDQLYGAIVHFFSVPYSN